MGTELTIANRPKLTSLPDWVAHLGLNSTGTGQTYLSRPLLKTERIELEAVARECRRAVASDPGQPHEADVSRKGLVAELLLAYPIAGGQQVAAARGKAYLAAVEGVPPWALNEAIKKWHRGEAEAPKGSPSYNFEFAPPPATLRKLAMEYLAPFYSTLNHADALLFAAESLSEAERRPRVRVPPGGLTPIGDAGAAALRKARAE
jgi:hypothetical protein